MKEITLVAHQPEYFPWLGFISKAQLADVYYIVDNVQYMKEHWHNRNKIRNKEGWLWINTPILGKSKIQMWPEVRIDNSQPWKRKQLNSIKMCYSRSKYFNEIYSELEKVYSKNYEFLIDFNEQIIKYAFKKFKIKVPIFKTTELIKQGHDIPGTKTDLILNMCKAANAKTFIFGQDGRTYIEENKFKQAEVKYKFQNFNHPIYKQRYPGFESNMSFIDLLFNHGNNSIEILKQI